MNLFIVNNPTKTFIPMIIMEKISIGLTTEKNDYGPEATEHVRYEYAALMSMCDHYLGQVLDLMDEFDMWKDTMLIVNTDHGFMLGEKEWMEKMFSPSTTSWYIAPSSFIIPR